MNHPSTQALNDGQDDLRIAALSEPVDFPSYPEMSDSDPYADAELKLRKERTETMIRRAQEAAT